ncbi:MAG: hypothetical protein AAF634_10090 [Bacteroidota bacterium]
MKLYEPIPFLKETVYWEGLPLYARCWIKHDYDQIQTWWECQEFISRYLEEYETTRNSIKRLAIAAVVLPMYERLTGQKYTVQQKVQLRQEVRPRLTKKQKDQMK